IPVSEVWSKKDKVYWRELSGQAMSDLPLRHPSLLTVDLDAFSLRRQPGVYLLSYHSNLEQVAQGMDNLISTLRTTNIHPLGLVTAISSSYLNPRRHLSLFAGRNWVNAAT